MAQIHVNSTEGTFTFQSLLAPTKLVFEFASTIYKEGRLKMGGWNAAREGLLNKLGKHVTDERLLDLTGKMFEELDSDGSGMLDKAELGAALKEWGVTLGDEELTAMIREATGLAGDTASLKSPKSAAELPKENEVAGDTAASLKNLKSAAELKRESEADEASPEEIDFDTFHEIVEQMYMGFKAGADMFKIDAEDGWLTNVNLVVEVVFQL
ncbi:hypothetical protein T484DRAFT_1791625 [Baffinella frigidus]|nr:hypothetical protein T484DRAFT_1791625 [Cryptophyta sp. CCMP2293]